MQSNFYTHTKIGAIALGPHDEGTADEQNCGEGSLSVGQNAMATGAGAKAAGYTDKQGGLVAAGTGSSVRGVALNESVVLAEGASSSATGRAVNKSQLLAKAESSSVHGNAMNGAVMEATGRGARVRGDARDMSTMTAEGAFSTVEGYALASGVLAADGEHSRIDSVANGGYFHVTGARSKASGSAEQFSELLLDGDDTTAHVKLSGSETAHTKAIVSANNSRVAIESAAGKTTVRGTHADVNVRNNGATLDVEAHSAVVTGAALLKSERLAANVLSSVSGRDIHSERAFSSSTGFHGTHRGLLPSYALFGGATGDSPPAFSADVMAYGELPLASASAATVRSSFPGFSEVHEWRDGNPFAEERIGSFVTFVDGELEIADHEADVDGVVVPFSSGVVANAQHPKLRLHTDHLGRPKILSDYSYAINIWLMRNRSDQKSVKYVAEPITDEKTMEETKEALGIPEDAEIKPVLMVDPQTVKVRETPVSDTTHATVCFLGSPIVVDNGNCTPGERCDCVNGAAVPGNTWKVLSRQSNTTIRILMK